MSIFRIGNNVPRINNNLFGIDFSPRASIGSITNEANPAASYNFNLYVPVFNSGFSNSFYVCVSCSTNAEYIATGTTMVLSQGTGNTSILVDKFNSGGNKTINVDLYVNGTYYLRKTYDLYVLPITTTSASGGIVTTWGSYTVHTFTGTTTEYFVINSIYQDNPTLSVNVLLVGGGASGGYGLSPNTGGGGGGGGILEGDLSLVIGSYAAKVGTGGSVTTGAGNNGGNTTFTGYTAYGGGGGASSGGAAKNGGSGGGGSEVYTSGGASTQNNQSPLTGHGTAGSGSTNHGGYIFGEGGMKTPGWVSYIDETSASYGIGGSEAVVISPPANKGMGGEVSGYRAGAWRICTKGYNGVIKIRYLT